jgi:MFS family permease
MAAPAPTESSSPPVIRSLIPARIDRLPWSKFHTRMVVALGVAWVLDGLEITIAANVGPDLTHADTLNMSAGAVADMATWYLIGQVIGALFFGRLSDKLGRRNLFMITLGVYLVGGGLTALTPAGGYWFIFLYATRVLAGAGIGGEYAAINSAIDEMIPAKYRGRVDLAVNGTYWAGAFLGTIVTLVFINNVEAKLGWRLAYLIGPLLGLIIIYVRRNLPESPRWQVMHGHEKEAEASIEEIEADVAATKGELPPVDPSRELTIRPTEQIGYWQLARVLFTQYPTRSLLGGALMITQSFLYNAIFFTYGLVLEFFFNVPTGDTPYYFMAFAVGNLLGPLTIGHLFDTIGRRKMISGTYLLSGVLLVITAQFFKAGMLNATTQTLCWAVIFFFASAGASAGYLTVSEVFPLEVRAKAIAIFFAIAQCFGSLGSHLYGHLIGDGHDPNKLYWGYLLGAGAMIVGGLVAVFFAVDAEGKSLEEVAKPLSVVAKPSEAIFRTGAPFTETETLLPSAEDVVGEGFGFCRGGLRRDVDVLRAGQHVNNGLELAGDGIAEFVGTVAKAGNRVGSRLLALGLGIHRDFHIAGVDVGGRREQDHQDVVLRVAVGAGERSAAGLLLGSRVGLCEGRCNFRRRRAGDLEAARCGGGGRRGRGRRVRAGRSGADGGSAAGRGGAGSSAIGGRRGCAAASQCDDGGRHQNGLCLSVSHCGSLSSSSSSSSGIDRSHRGRAKTPLLSCRFRRRGLPWFFSIGDDIRGKSGDPRIRLVPPVAIPSSTPPVPAGTGAL